MAPELRITAASAIFLIALNASSPAAVNSATPAASPATNSAPSLLPPACDAATNTIALNPISETQVSPSYPAISIRLDEKGTTVLLIQISKAGTVESSSVLTSSGYPRLDEAALTFVTSKWRWYPPTLHCRPVEALTKIQIVWNQVDAAPPADDERMLLGREILDAMHFDEKLLPFLRALETSDRQAFIINSQSLPASQRVPALQAFDDASNEATSKSVKAQIERYSQYIAGHSPTPDLQAAAALLKTPIGQVMFNPDMQTPNNKQELGKAVLAHPQIMQVFASLFGAEAQGLQVAAQRRAEFKIDLDKRLCAKLLAVGIQDAGCSAYSTSPPQ